MTCKLSSTAEHFHDDFNHRARNIIAIGHIVAPPNSASLEKMFKRELNQTNYLIVLINKRLIIQTTINYTTALLKSRAVLSEPILDETLVKIKGRWYYLYRAIDKYGNTLDWMLSRQQNAKAAMRFFKKAIAQPYVKSPRVVNVDKHASFPPAHQKAKDEGLFSSQCKLRRVKYLNNCIENDHKAVKRKSRFRQWYQSLSTARPTIDIMEAMRMVQKGQLRYIKKQNICAQNQLIDKLFGLAA
ncbi:Integrase core domain protein (plasmid) [Piscirickettsia salmonis]|nr:Integrase core domain protein [Piscirickettsia salmonis]QGN82953.1 Integrase core domain protein [Piscirickettsia salmonis]QGN86468.1 Integrase core domain protein [Piscirickettsia salmonis]QGN89972.1 Integrase core domain protein [Piscirickettsia salmonis]QGO11349.1 Integrase core domain protein [Piscirickettsia salmonis]